MHKTLGTIPSTKGKGREGKIKGKGRGERERKAFAHVCICLPSASIQIISFEPHTLIGYIGFSLSYRGEK
jgi:hypothetical protein